MPTFKVTEVLQNEHIETHDSPSDFRTLARIPTIDFLSSIDRPLQSFFYPSASDEFLVPAAYLQYFHGNNNHSNSSDNNFGNNNFGNIGIIVY